MGYMHKEERCLLDLWRLRKIQDWDGMYECLVLEGHLLGRKTIPDGSIIQTSAISTCKYDNEGIIFYTSNSVYRCRYADFAFDDSETLLKTGNYLSEENSYSVISRKLMEAKAAEENCVRKIFSSQHLDEGLVVQWNGCSLPYIKTTGHMKMGKLDMRHGENMITRQFVCLYTNGGMLTMSASTDRPKPEHVDRKVGQRIILWNSGEKKVFISFGNEVPREVGPKSVVTF